VFKAKQNRPAIWQGGSVVLVLALAPNWSSRIGIHVGEDNRAGSWERGEIPSGEDGSAPAALSDLGETGYGYRYGRRVRYGFKTAPMDTTWSAMLDVWRVGDQLETF
jgi:hypothetical protein